MGGMTGSRDSVPKRKQRFFGRSNELAQLMGMFSAEGPELMTVIGVPGIGKSSLLHAFVEQARLQGEQVLIFDCRTLEPTVRSFESALDAAGWSRPTDPSSHNPTVLCLDHFDHFLLLDAWLRGRCLSFVDEGLKLVLSGQSGPGTAWSTTGLRTRSLKLDGLGQEASAALLSQSGVEEPRAEQLLHFTKGHPLALQLASAWPQDESHGELDSLPSPELVHRLTRYFLDNVEDPVMREALEASSTVRRVTQPMLDEMLESSAGHSQFEELAALPLVEVRSDGLSLHPTVHEMVASWLRAADPSRLTAYRRRAWKALQRRGQNIAAGDTWRFTADVIYLIDDWVVRDAFFPTSMQSYSVEPAGPDDHDAILEITELHDGAEQRQVMSDWLESLPTAFHVVRDQKSAIQGFYCLINPKDTTEEVLARDAQTDLWHADYETSGGPPHQHPLYIRRWLSRVWGDSPSPVQAACWLDIKRSYLEQRPHLRRAYMAVSDATPYAQAARKLGFIPFTKDDEIPFFWAMLDFGPDSVDAWLVRLVEQSLGMDEAVELDVERHALSIGTRSLPLTPRELAVVRILLASRGAVVSRDTLLKEAWEGGHAVGSNVVDVLIRGLRKKLEDRAELIDTVRGAGYCWRD